MTPGEDLVPQATLIVVFTTSLLGSLHCVGMCGPFVAVYSAAAENPSPRRGAWQGAWAPHAAYHGGRALTYVTLGALGGAAGAAVDWAGEAAGLVHVAAIVSSVLVILWGLGVLYPRLRIASPLDGLLKRRLVQLKTKPRVVRASALGIFTPLLPCGWLYAFVVTAAGTGHALSGGLVMVAFWAGTVPALLGAGAVFSRVGRALRARLPLISGIALILVGLTGVVTRALRPAPETGSAPTEPSEARPCH